MYGDDGPEDDYMTPEQACEAGWLTPDEAEELRALLKHVEWPADLTSPGVAALILIDTILNNPMHEAGSDAQRRYEWAKVKLGRHILA